MQKSQKNKQLLATITLAIILFVGLILRLYKINSPLADYHSWRQADTASVAKIFAEEGFDLLKPRYHDLSSVQSGKENPEGLRMVEFPIYNAAVAFVYKQIGMLPVEVYGRIVSIFAALLSIAIIFYLMKKEYDLKTAAIAGFSFATLPFIVYFTRVVLPEPTAVAFLMLAIFFAYLFSYEEYRRKAILFYFISLIFFALSLLVKPTTIFYAIVIFYLIYRRYDIFAFTRPQTYLYFITAVIPVALWRFYILKYPEGIPAFSWLTTTVNTPRGLENIFFKPSFFYWVFFQRINNLILGGFLTFFLIYALVRTRNALVISFLLSSLAYLFTFQGGNVQHEYYQTLIFPTIAILIAAGFHEYYRQTKHKFLTYPVFIIIFAFSWYFSFKLVKPYYNIPSDLINYATIIKSFTNKDDLIITDRNGDTTLLYLSDRKGYPVFPDDFEKLRKQGYKYFATDKPEAAKSLLKQYPFLKVAFKSNKFYLLKIE